jgi:tRNA(Ile)-lysidine synthase
MALLACLWELGPRLGLELEVATVDHGLRPGAAVETSLVAERAADLGLPFHPIRVDVAAARQRPGRDERQPARTQGAVVEVSPGMGPRVGGVQEVARRLRLLALTELATKRGLDQIALGHHGDDQTETVLFRILRGTGLKGLNGIPYQRGPFIRPLLDVTRAQILAYLNRRSLPFATDPSNADLRYARARLRHQILPLLRRENPRVDRALRSLATAAAQRLSEPPGLGEVVGSGVHIPSRVLAEIQNAAGEGHGTRSFDVSGGRKVTVSYGQVSLDARRVDLRGARVVVPETRRITNDAEFAPTTTICGPGTYHFAAGVDVVIREEDTPRRASRRDARNGDHDHDDQVRDGWCWFDGALLSFPLVARPRRPGDRMRPRGGTGSRKLSDLLIDAKIPRHTRGTLPVVTTAQGELLFVPGLRPARTAAPSVSTIRWIGLAVVPNADHDALVDRPIIRGNTGRYP